MSMPSQKPGMAMNKTDNARATPSGRLFGLNALRIPTGRPTSQETMKASTPISALIGPRSGGGGGGGAFRPPPRQSSEPDLIPSNDVIDPKVRARVLAFDLVVPGVVDLLVGHRDERRVLLQDVLRLADHRLAPVVVQLALDLVGEVVEAGVRPVRVVLRAVLAVPGAEVVGRIHQRRDDRADTQIEVAAADFV